MAANPRALLLLVCLTAVSGGAQAPRAVLLDGEGPWSDEGWKLAAREFAQLLKEAGYNARVVAPARLADELDPRSDQLLAAPSLERLPVAAFRKISEFVAGGGDLLATGGEPFREALYPAGGNRWLAQREILAAVKPGKIVFEPASARVLRRISDNFRSAPALDLASPGPAGWFDTLTVRIPTLTGWDMLEAKPFESSPFQAGQTLTILSVRGTPGQSIAVQWEEVDGTQWTARAPLSADWQTHALRPADFQQEVMLFNIDERLRASGSAPRALRGRVFNPAAAHILRFGASTSFGSSPGMLEYTIGPIGLGTPPSEASPFEPPAIETISPWYKQYPATRNGRPVRIPIARARGLTAAPQSSGRYHAVGDVTDPVATRYFASTGAALIWLPWPEVGGPVRGEVIRLLRSSAAGVGFMNAGAKHVVSLPGEPVEFGARVLNASSRAVNGQVRWTVRRGSESVISREASLSLAPGQTGSVEAGSPQPAPVGEYRVETTLWLDGIQCDHIDGFLRVLDPAGRHAQSEHIRVAGGRFAADGKPAFLNGVNYWPRYVAGLRIEGFTEPWLKPRNYDPEIVEADLKRIADLGMNLVSIQYVDPELARPLMDFLERCRAHGIWVNLFTGSAGSLRLNQEREKKLVQDAHLRGNDRVFAYDLTWEPKFGGHKERRAWDSEWRAWITEQYDSIEAAEKIWGTPAPRDSDGTVTNPSDVQIRTDGPHRVMVAAYRRFLDDLVSRRYGRVVRSLRTLHPEALMGVRSGYGGTGTPFHNVVAGYDLTSGAAHLDFISPEAYGMPVDFEDARGTGFITAYARWAGNGKPVFWCEFGSRVGVRYGTPATHEGQARLAETMMRVIEDSEADGATAWWWPGGWRINEESDYGISNPDGTPRESARRQASWGRRLSASYPPRGQAPETITIDRDADARGLSGLWERTDSRYLAARKVGRPVRLVTEATGTTTATMPLVQVGNIPYQGAGPLKYANAEIAAIRVTWNGGEQVVENGSEVRLPDGADYDVTVTLLNTGEATWLKSNCALIVGIQRLPLQEDVARFGTTNAGPLRMMLTQEGAELKGRLTIDERGRFGEELRVRLLRQ